MAVPGSYFSLDLQMKVFDWPELQHKEADSLFHLDCTGYIIFHICL